MEIINNKVHRPTGYWTKQVHQFLNYLQQQNFNSIPIPLGFDEHGREIVSYVEGQTYDYPLTNYGASDNAVISAAKLLRKYHDVSVGFLINEKLINYKWMFDSKNPQEVICHNDYAPYNICFHGDQAVGIIDFDTACPGPRI